MGEFDIRKAIQEIAPPPAPELTPTAKPDGDGVFVAVKDGYQVHRLEGRRRGSRRHTFHDVRSFAEFLNRHAKEREKTEILVGAEGILAVPDPRDPEGDRIACDLVAHPSFEAWENALDQAMGQKAFYALVRAQVDTFLPATTTGGGDGPSTGKLLAQELSKLKVVSGGDLEQHLDATGCTIFQGSNSSQKVTGKIPSEIRVRVPIIEGVEKVEPPDPNAEGPPEYSYVLELLLDMEIGDNGPVFALRCPGLELVKRRARRDAIAWLTHLLDDEFLVGMGDLAITAVPDRKTE